MSSSKGKAPASTNGVTTYTKEDLGDIIIQLQKEKVQFIAINEGLTNKKEMFEVDKDRFFKEKNTLVDKRDKLKEQLVVTQLNKEPEVKPRKENLKTKRLSPFDNTKRILQRFIIETRYFQEFYSKDLSYNLNRVQDVINNMVSDIKDWVEPLLRDFLENESDSQD